MKAKDGSRSAWVLLVVSLVFNASRLLGQNTAQVAGRITDSTDAVLPDASITAVNIETGIRREAASNEQGYYAVPLLQPGKYRITVQKEGFRPMIRDGVVLETGSARTVDFQLQVGTVTETVEVRAETPLLEAEKSSVGQFIERATVSNMPLQSRRAGALVGLTGGVLYQGEVGTGDFPAVFSLAGGRSRNQQWLLDGTTVQNSALGTAQVAINPPVESLQEFNVEVNAFTAEIGRAGGGAIIMTTRSGTNRFHGAAYEFLRNDKLDARSFFAFSKAPLRYNVFGVSAGGPIVKDKTFFFFNYEGARRREGVTYSNDTVPRPAEVAGDFSSRRDVQVRDPLTSQPFAGNRIPANRIDPIGGAVAKFYPVPNSPADDPTRAPAANFINNASNAINTNYYFARIDHNFGHKDRLYGRIIYFKNASQTAAVYPNRVFDPRDLTQEVIAPTFGVNWIRNLTPNVFNELRFERLNSEVRTVRAAVGSNMNQQLGLKGADPTYAPIVLVTGLTTLGSVVQSEFLPKRLTQQLIENVSWIRGSHTIKAGFEFRFSHFVDDVNLLPGGQFTFTDRATSDGLATLLLGWTTSAALDDADVLSSRSDYWGAFLQDNWKISPKLTLSLGLRWEMDTPRWEKNNRQNGVDLLAMNPVSGTRGIVTFSGRDGASKYANDFDKNNFGPHAGFAWRLNEMTVIRGGYGLNYLGAYRSVPDALSGGFGKLGSFESRDGGFTPAFLFRDGMPPIARPELGPGFGAVPVGQSPIFAPQFIAANHQNGYSQHWNLNLQRQFRGQFLAELAYLANVGHKLPGGNLSLNVIPLVNGRGPAQQDQRLRFYPQYSGLTELGPDWGNSTYHAVNLKLEKRYSGGLNLLMNYTWAKFIDGGFEGFQHPDLRQLDKSLSVSDVPHRLAGATVYELPMGRGKHLAIENAALNQVIGGWSLGLIGEVRDGTPFGVVEQTNRSNTFSQGQRSNIVGNPYLPMNRRREEIIAQYFDTSAFAAPGIGVFGDAPRTFLRGPGAINLDVSVHKKWLFSERYNLQFRADFFNLPNRPNFSLPNGARGNANFGRITSVTTTGTGRLTQFSLRLEF